MNLVFVRQHARHGCREYRRMVATRQAKSQHYALNHDANVKRIFVHSFSSLADVMSAEFTASKRGREGKNGDDSQPTPTISGCIFGANVDSQLRK